MRTDPSTGPAATPSRLQLRKVPAADGGAWVRRGIQVFLRQPLGFAALFASFMFALFVLQQFPLIGILLVIALVPQVSLGFMTATRRALAGQFPGPRVFVESLRGPRPQVVALVQLGLAYAVGVVVIVFLAGHFDGGALKALMASLAAADKSPQAVTVQLGESSLWFGLLLRLALASALSVPFWHAPALVVWGGQGAAQSLFSSTVACWRNRGAFAVYALVWSALVLAVGAGGSLVFGLLGQAQWFAFAAVPLSLMLTTVFYASLWFSFADCFSAAGADADGPPPPLSPLAEKRP
jgi:hypothetical protein